MRTISTACLFLLSAFSFADVLSQEVKLLHGDASALAAALQDDAAIGIKVVKSRNAIVLCGEEAAVRNAAKRLAVLDVEREIVTVQMRAYRDSKLVFAPAVRVLIDKEAFVVVTSKSAFGFKVTPKRIGSLLSVRPTLIVDTNEYMLPGHIPPQCTVAFITDENSTTMRVTDAKSKRVSEHRLGKEWADLADLTLEFQVDSTFGVK